MADYRLAQQRVENGARVRQAGGLDDNALEGGNLAALAPAQQTT